ncbi:polysaccharide deacetylase family protein [Modestobacter sp. SSW1-42]|uniref:polysaccharide deacetylase family protein n=1 Tax=Modestobacter sp. SSW1-42 TaxID=596372 RepID=UPI003987265F
MSARPLGTLARRTTRPLARGLAVAAGSVVGSVVAVRTSAPHVVLTFDDGPEPGGTDRVLTALAERGATATFFVLLGRVRRHPQLLADVVAAGHEIGLHGVDHRALTDLSSAEVTRRTADGRAELEDRTGRPVRWSRPPYGRQTVRTWRAVTRAGLTPVLWGPTTWDWRDISTEERRRAAQRGIGRGAIVLAHDGFAGPADGVDDGPAPILDRGELIGAVLDDYAAQGLVARSLGDALVTGELVRTARFRR